MMACDVSPVAMFFLRASIGENVANKLMKMTLIICLQDLRSSMRDVRGSLIK